MKLLFIAALMVTVTIVVGQGPQVLKDQTIVFANVNLVTMENDQVQKDRFVTVRNGKVVSIENGMPRAMPANTITVDGRGKYLMPGLAEMHAHVPPIDDIEPMKEVLLLFAVNGVTTIRGMLGHPRHLELRSKLKTGEIPGPVFYTSGPSFNGSTVPTPAIAESRVKEQKSAGYDFLKIHPGIALENFNALARTAKVESIPFAGHVPYGVGIWRAIEAGYATIDHMDGFVESLIPGIENIKENETGLFSTYIGHRADTSRIKKLTTALRNGNIWVVPTQALAERWLSPLIEIDELTNAPEMVYMDPKTVANWTNTKRSLLANPAYNKENVERFIMIRRKLIYECNKDGVGLLLGSDGPQVFNVPGFSVHHELQYLVDAGLTPYEAIRTGTVNVGKFYNQPLKGRIMPGSPAELILLKGNPLADISQTKSIEVVLIGNQFYSAETIKAVLNKLKKN